MSEGVGGAAAGGDAEGGSRTSVCWEGSPSPTRTLQRANLPHDVSLSTCGCSTPPSKAPCVSLEKTPSPSTSAGLGSTKPRFTAELLCPPSLPSHPSFAHCHQSLTLLRQPLLVAFSSPVSLNPGLQTLLQAYVSLYLNQGLVLSFLSHSSDHLSLTQRTGENHIPRLTAKRFGAASVHRTPRLLAVSFPRPTWAVSAPDSCERCELQHSEAIVFSHQQPALRGTEFDAKCSTLLFGYSARVWVFDLFVALWVS